MPGDKITIEQHPEPEQQAKQITLGSGDSAEILARYGTRLALQGRVDPMGLASIMRPADAAVH